MGVDIRKIKKLIELLERTDLTEIEVTEDKESVRLSRSGHYAAAPSQNFVQVPPAMSAQAATAVSAQSNETKAPAVDDEVHYVKSPMVGTCYLASTPGGEPLVKEGDTVCAGDVICIVEAMKMFNQIEADRDGKVTARLVENDEPVEFGQALFIIE